MSVLKDSRSPYWRFDFQVGGHRFFGSTKARTRREAEAVERAEKEKAKRHVAQARAAATSLRLDDVAGRYWQEVGQHHAGARNTERQLGYLIDFFGKDMVITDIGDGDLTKLVAWRRGHQSRGGKHGGFKRGPQRRPSRPIEASGQAPLRAFSNQASCGAGS